MAYDAQTERTADHIGPRENIWDIYDLPPTVVGGEEYGPWLSSRSVPRPGRSGHVGGDQSPGDPAAGSSTRTNPPAMPHPYWR
jgi:hypothetical protein